MELVGKWLNKACSPVFTPVTNNQVCGDRTGGPVRAYVPGQQRRYNDVCSTILAEERDLASTEQDASGNIQSRLSDLMSSAFSPTEHQGPDFQKNLGKILSLA